MVYATPCLLHPGACRFNKQQDYFLDKHSTHPVDVWIKLHLIRVGIYTVQIVYLCEDSESMQRCQGSALTTLQPITNTKNAMVEACQYKITTAVFPAIASTVVYTSSEPPATASTAAAPPSLPDHMVDFPSVSTPTRKMPR